jgi:MFS-type transporter involved in bile tolerance (Atg22 family)
LPSTPTGRLRRALRSWAAEVVPDRGLSRRLAVLAVVQAGGFGVFLTASAIFFTRTVGLTAGQVGLGLTVANLFGLLCTVPIGRLADRFGPRPALLVTYAGLAVLFALYCWVGSFAAFVVLTSLISIGETSVNPLRMTLTKASFPPAEQVRVSSQMRSVFNIGFMLGALVAGVALTVGTRGAFVAVVLTTAVVQAACLLIILRLPVPPHVRASREVLGASRSGLRDARFVGLSVLNGVIELFQPILTIGLPLWIVTWTDAPAGLNSVLLIVDTIIVFVFQVAVSRGATTTDGSARILRRAGLLLAGSCLVFALTQDTGTAVAAPLLIVGAVVLVIGELSQAAGAFGLSLYLPPPGRQGEYQGVFALGRGLQQTVGPILVTSLVIGPGRPGWVAMAALFAVAGLLVVPLARSAEQAVRAGAPQPAAAG